METASEHKPSIEKFPGPVPLPGLLGLIEEALLEEFSAALRATEFSDVRPTHGCVFRFLRDEGMRPTQLAALAGMTKQSVGEITDDLAARGYVERIPDPEDRRAKLIRLTAKGKEAQRTGHALFGQLEERWAERYGEKQIAQLRELLEEIAVGEAPEQVPELARERSALR